MQSPLAVGLFSSGEGDDDPEAASCFCVLVGNAGGGGAAGPRLCPEAGKLDKGPPGNVYEGTGGV